MARISYRHQDRVVSVVTNAGQDTYAVPFDVYGSDGNPDITVTVNDSTGTRVNLGGRLIRTPNGAPSWQFRTTPEAGSVISFIGMSSTVEQTTILTTFAQVNSPNLNMINAQNTARVATLKQLLDIERERVLGTPDSGSSGVDEAEVRRIIATVETDQLSSELRLAIDDKVEAGSIAVDGRTISFDDGAGNSYSVTIDDMQTQSQVDARVKAGVEDWAETGNGSQIPRSKLNNAPGSSPTEEQVFDHAKNIVVEGVGIDVEDDDDANTIQITLSLIHI